MKAIKNWAPEDRPRERLLLNGAETLSKAELLAILIGSGVPGKSAVEVMRGILSDYGDSLMLLAKASVQELMRYEGIGEAKALTIIAAAEIGKRRMMEDCKDIPQFSSIGDADKAMQILMNVGNPEITYREIGYFLDGADKTDGANQKYGEGHLKLAQALGFVSFDGRKQFVNAFGKTYLLFSASDSVRSEAVKAKMVLRVPFIQHMIALSAEKPGVRVIDELHKLCSDATARRRRSNIETLVNLLYEQYDKEVNSLLRRVDWESLR